MKYSNLDRIDWFGRANISMSDEASHALIDLRLARLMSYIDMRLVKRWVLPALPKGRLPTVSVLDAGAGTGRMT